MYSLVLTNDHPGSKVFNSLSPSQAAEIICNFIESKKLKTSSFSILLQCDIHPVHHECTMELLFHLGKCVITFSCAWKHTQFSPPKGMPEDFADEHILFYLQHTIGESGTKFKFGENSWDYNCVFEDINLVKNILSSFLLGERVQNPSSAKV